MRRWVDQVVFTPSPLVLTLAPGNQTVGAGGGMQLSVTAASLQPLSYQWRLNGSNIAAATNSALVLNTAQWTDAGLYSVVVSNSVGSVTSSPAIVNVAPKIFAQPSGSGLLLTWSGSFVLQSATNPFGPYTDQTGALSPYLQDTSAGGPQFFRLRSQPFSLTLAPQTNGGVTIAGAGISGFNFYILASTNLIDWSRVSTNPSPFSFTDTNTTLFPCRFYRSVLAR